MISAKEARELMIEHKRESVRSIMQDAEESIQWAIKDGRSSTSVHIYPNDLKISLSDAYETCRELFQIDGYNVGTLGGTDDSSYFTVSWRE